MSDNDSLDEVQTASRIAGNEAEQISEVEAKPEPEYVIGNVYEVEGSKFVAIDAPLPEGGVALLPLEQATPDEDEAAALAAQKVSEPSPMAPAEGVAFVSPDAVADSSSDAAKEQETASPAAEPVAQDIVQDVASTQPEQAPVIEPAQDAPVETPENVVA